MEERTWVAKVRSETNCASSFGGVQHERGCAPTFPDVQELPHSRGGAGHVGHPGHRAADLLLPPTRLAHRPLQSLLRSVFKLFKLGRLDM